MPPLLCSTPPPRWLALMPLCVAPLACVDALVCCPPLVAAVLWLCWLDNWHCCLATAMLSEETPTGSGCA